MKLKYIAHTSHFAGDMHTPVSLYLKLRDLFPQSALLESSDYHSHQNSTSFIALAPLASVSINDSKSTMSLPDGQQLTRKISEQYGVDKAVGEFLSLFDVEGDSRCGVFGYTAYDAVKYLENIPVKSHKPEDNDAPDVLYILYRFTLIFDHFHNTLTMTELLGKGEQSSSERIQEAINNRNYAAYSFRRTSPVSSTIDDERYREMVRSGIAHCNRGDVFQIVLSRRFEQPFMGDDFCVYRALRSINPSPYLFYFDFGGFRIFGSSPETHCKIEGRKITIDPIAGTAFRTGDAQQDAHRAEALLGDPKESAEHVMLVDLARNDLSRNAYDVNVELYKEVQYFSHVIHLVSRVNGLLPEQANPITAFVDTFPAGTLSGAPKVRAMELINSLEPHNRGIYGGAIGFIGFDGSLNQAITIRTFVSRNGKLHFQAGAGVVSLSNPERELQEVNNKLGALSKAIQRAENPDTIA